MAAPVLQLAIRRIGPALVATLMPIRVVSAIVGSYVVLDERVESVQQWLGICAIVVVVTLYLWLTNTAKGAAFVAAAVARAQPGVATGTVLRNWLRQGALAHGLICFSFGRRRPPRGSESPRHEKDDAELLERDCRGSAAPSRPP